MSEKVLCVDDEKNILEAFKRHLRKKFNLYTALGPEKHEINTPTQYVGDNLRFFQESFEDLAKVIEKLLTFLEEAKECPNHSQKVKALKEFLEEVDIEFLMSEIPKAVEQSLEGIERVAKIVRAMKEFSHPGVVEKALTDINKAIENTVTVSRNEWKYVADMELDLDPNLPMVPCHASEFNQVILNLITNSAHAIEDVVGKNSGKKGKIRISTRLKGDWVEIRISDTGAGIPEEIRSRIFDPFFTTKEVGRGTGQGLAIARNVIVEKHGGEINFESELGKGTTFIIKLPL